MIRSMTGFGAATLGGPLGEFHVEVKSLNNRFLDLSVRLPRELASLDMAVREEVKGAVRRGKVDLFMRWIPAAGAEPACAINAPLLRHYAAQVRAALADEAGASVDVGALLGLPGVVVNATSDSDTAAIEQSALGAVREALAALDSSRASEGRTLAAAIEEHLSVLAGLRSEIAGLKDELLVEYRKRLGERAAELASQIGVNIDPGRLELEVAMFTDKSDITEELVRLDSHIPAFRKLCRPDKPEPVGKSMDFLTQELLREANTVGNKARGTAIATRIVEMKSEIEKIREQVQNIE